MHMKDFWNRVDSLREIQGMTQLRLAEKIGKSHRTVEDWKKRSYVPNGLICVKIAKIFSTTTEYLITGEELELPDDDYVLPYKPVVQAYTNINVGYDEETSVVVPVIPQRISIGSGEVGLRKNHFIGYVRILKRIAKDVDTSSLVATSVKGDSMIGIQLFEGDLVIFVHGRISENGIYVILLFGEVKVKRLEFRAVEQLIYIHSDNSHYSTEKVEMRNEHMVILGKVVGWVHCHPY